MNYCFALETKVLSQFNGKEINEMINTSRIKTRLSGTRRGAPMYNDHSTSGPPKDPSWLGSTPISLLAFQ